MPKEKPKKMPIQVPLLYRGERLLGTSPSESMADTMAANLNRGRSGSDLVTWRMGGLEEAELQLKKQRGEIL
jgi:hypothetical protein